jgi:hypothetical protein
MEKIGKGLLALRSLNLNFYSALKAAFVFKNDQQLRKLVSFVSGKKYAEMVVRKVCQQYGLELVQDLPVDNLETPPVLGQSAREPRPL